MKKVDNNNRRQDQLTQLIRSLSANEKRHFKLNNYKNEGSKKYALLFDELVSSEVYLPNTISNNLGISSKQLADDKKYLEYSLLKSLRGYHEQQDFVCSNNLLCNAWLLIEKRSYAIAENQIQKGITISEKHNWHYLGYQFYRMKMLLDNRSLTGNASKLDARLSENIKKARAALDFLKLQLDFEELNGVFINHSAQRMVDRTSIERAATRRFLRHPLLIRTSSVPYFRKEQYALKSKVYFMLGDFKQAARYSEKVLQLFEKHPLELQIETHDYFITLNNHFHILVSTNQFKKIEAFVNKLETAFYEKMPLDAEYISKRMCGYIPLFRAIYYQRRYSINGKIPDREITLFLARTESRIPEIKYALYETTWYGFLLTMANLNFLLNEMEGASRWHNMILQEGDTRIIRQVHCISRITLCIIHAQLGNYLLLPSLVTSARYLLKKYNLATDVETTVLGFLSKLPKIKTESERKAAYRNLHQQIEKFSKDKEMSMAVRAIPYQVWIKRNM